jgi:hypothetical protein
MNGYFLRREPYLRVFSIISGIDRSFVGKVVTSRMDPGMRRDDLIERSS